MSLRPSLSDAAECAPPALRDRVLRAYRRRTRLGAAGALAAGLAFVAGMTVLTPMQPPHDGAMSPTMATGVPDAPLRDVAVVDHALQVAYARGASEDEVAPLWHERARLLRALDPGAI
jgi:hypothetical protein